MLSLLPDALITWIVNLIIIVGVTGILAGWIGKWIPFYGNYAQFLKPLGIALVVIGVYFKGGTDNELAWRAKVAEWEAKIAVSEQKSKDANKQLADALKGKTQAERERQAAVQQRIKQDAAKIDANCVVASEAIIDLNEAAKSIKGKVTVEGVKK